VTELDEWLRRMEQRVDTMEVTNDKLGELRDEMNRRFKGLEINMTAGFSKVTARQDIANDATAKLKEAEIRRDEREKVVAATLAATSAKQSQGLASVRWAIGAGIAGAGVVSGIVAEIVTRL